MTDALSNHSLREDIRDYWSLRAQTYDIGRGHGIAAGREHQAWLGLIAHHLGPANGRSALDLASGTGEFAQVMQASGYAVTGLDFAEPMLEKARAKAKAANLPIRYLLRDCEDTHEPDGQYDVLVCRNLVWTLVDPAAAFAEWHRLLRPGGSLLIVDADHVSTTWADRLHSLWSQWFGARPDGHSMLTAAQWSNHHDIVRRLPFSTGARADSVSDLLREAGFAEVEADTALRSIRNVQAAGTGWTGWLRGHVRHRFVIHARKSDEA